MTLQELKIRLNDIESKIDNLELYQDNLVDNYYSYDNIKQLLKEADIKQTYLYKDKFDTEDKILNNSMLLLDRCFQDDLISLDKYNFLNSCICELLNNILRTPEEQNFVKGLLKLNDTMINNNSIIA